MATEIIPQDLLIYRTILRDSLAKITNEMYAQNKKLSYRNSFEKLEEKKQRPSMFLDNNKPIYLFRVFVIDKSRNPIGETIYLYNMYYPKDFDTSIYQLERMAIQEWFTMASKALYNVLQESRMEEFRAKQAFIDSRAAEGVTAENLAVEITANDAKLVKQREAEILAMMGPAAK